MPCDQSLSPICFTRAPWQGGWGAMRIRMLVEKTGPRYDGRMWPYPGGEIDVPDEEGAALCAQGDAAPVAQADADVETREKPDPVAAPQDVAAQKTQKAPAKK